MGVDDPGYMPGPVDSAYPEGVDTSANEWYHQEPISEPAASLFSPPSANEKPWGMNHPFGINRTRFGYRDAETGKFQQPKVRRGYIRPQNYTPELTGGKPLRLHFMWNPGELATSYAVNEATRDPSQQPAAQTGADGGEGVSPAAGYAVWNFAIAFNRELEVARKVPSISDVQKRGVLHDIDVFESIVQKHDGVNISAMPVTVVFSPELMFIGYVTQSAVTYQKFSMAYVPTLCTLSLTLEISYMGAYVPPAKVTAIHNAWWENTTKWGGGGSGGSTWKNPLSNFDTDSNDPTRTGGQSAAQPSGLWSGAWVVPATAR